MDIPGAHAVNMQEGQNFARKHRIEVCKEVSAKTSEGVDALFHAIAVQCWDNKEKFVSNKINHQSNCVCIAFTNEEHIQA